MNLSRTKKNALSVLSASVIVVLVSMSLAIFFFDHQLIVFKKVLPEKIAIFTSVSDLGPLLRYFLLFLPVVALSVLVPGALRARRTGQALAEGLAGQTLTLVPLLFLSFGRFFSGKHLQFIFSLPLYPLLVAGAAASVLFLNASYHLEFRLSDFIRERAFPGQRAREGRGRTVILLGLAGLLLVHFMTLSPFFRRFSSLMIFTGDEPKYLRMTHSLATDGDLDVTDDFVGDEVEVQWRLEQARAAGERAIGHFSIVGRDGGIYHFHMPGISFLILPGYLLDLAVFERDIPNTQALMFLPARMVFTRLMFFMLALGMFLLAARFFFRMFGSRAIAGFLLLALVLATKVPEFLFQVYPESAAIFFLLLGLNAVFFPFRNKGWNAFSLVLAIGCLPWLHQRYIPLAACLYGLFLFQEFFERKSWKHALTVSLALTAAGLGYLYYFFALTGDPWPWSLYSLWGTSYTRLAILPSGFFGYLFDTGSGLLSLAPVFFFTLTGIYWGIRLDRRRAVKLLALILPYFGLISVTPWHGLAWETARMSLVLFPVFLAFAGYNLRAVASRTSWAHIVFYAAGLGFILWNRLHRLWDISLGNVLILPHQVGYIIQCFIVLVLFYLAFWGLDVRAQKKRRALPSLDQVRRLVERALQRLRAVGRGAAPRRALTVLAVVLPAAYILVFLKNWDDKTLAMSYFDALNKVERSSQAALQPKGYSSSSRRKGEAKFMDIFNWTVPIELLPERNRTVVRFGPGYLADRCPPGSYKVDLEFFDPPPELTLLAFDFLRESREMPIDPHSGRVIVSTIYLVFRDMPVSPEFVIRHEGRIVRPVKGVMHFFPIPSLVFDKKLIVRLSEGLYPNCIRTNGTHTYLGFIANTRKDNSSFRLNLSLLEKPGGGKGTKETPLGAYSIKLRNRGRHKFDIRLDRPDKIWPEEGTIIFSVSDARGRPMACRSVWLPFRKNAWLISFGMERPYGQPPPPGLP
ncbi:MAG: hypothetical protein A2Y86_04160 [Candidatus Aminicenantes bacterium RBG_13_62_12]|nr:MAG: hypothetical protein A2Y86_04160 [Candidatus Aminicenantes bacterium RBG_13_62_12]